MKTIIGLTGVKQSGKTSCFQALKEKYPYIQEIALANKLKNACAEIFNISRDYFDSPEFKEKELDTLITLDSNNVKALLEYFGLSTDYDKYIRLHMCKILHTPREIAQYVGTEILRYVDEQVHCKGSVEGLPSDGVFVTTDIRFWNEYNFFKNNSDWNFFPFYVENYRAEAKAALDTHASERYVLEIAKKCEKIDSNGTLQELNTAVLEILGPIVEKIK